MGHHSKMDCERNKYPHGEQGMEEKEAAKLDSDDVEEDPLPWVDIRTACLEPNHKAVFFTNLLVKISTRINHLC